MKKVSSTSQIAESLEENPEIEKEIQDDPKSGLLNNFNIVSLPDNDVYRLIIIALGATVVSVVIAYITFIIRNPGGQFNSGLIALASTAVGAIGGLLAPQPGNS